MGLDMSLLRKNYLYKKTFTDTSEDGREYNNVRYIIEEVGYWRKANAIHRWFVENVQKGNDDCGEYYVSEEMLKKLKNTCQKVIDASELVGGKIKNGYTYKDGKKEYNIVDGFIIKDDKVAKELLPTQEGFFFGSTEYNQYYLDDVKDTIKIINKILSEEGSDSIYYSSSW